ncbi:DUF5320 domain-containing protein [Desulfobacterales bacterium HSG17]|nr:DUF5320 domain-containing protein [Desulfobacterales bacterium HSG17]
MKSINKTSKKGIIMPGYDKSGPMGNGPMSGGRKGVCFQGKFGMGAGGNMGFGRGQGCGRGIGNSRGASNTQRGMGRGFARMDRFAPSSTYAAGPADEISLLKAEADSMKNALDLTNRRIAELENIAAKPEAENETEKG